MMRRRRRGPKQIPETALTSELGVNLVARRVMEMGHAWHPTVAAFDAGIDGIIELRDRATAEALNLIVQVQVKSTRGRWASEQEDSFEFVCEERDLAHWRRGNAPVVLVVTRPETDEAYWVSIKDYFSDPMRLKERRVRFAKTASRFDASASDALFRLAVSPNSGLFAAPLNRREWLFTNLVPVTRMPAALYNADTSAGRRGDVWQGLGNMASLRAEFVYRGKRILTVHDMREPEWRDIVDRGTAEPFPTTEWALSNDKERLDNFTELLGRCLSERLRALGIRYHSDHEFYYFEAPDDLSARVVTYASLRQQSSRTVFQKYETKTGFVYYRHLAFEARFRRYDGTWYLDITPTYHFTVDGRRQLHFYESKLRGIKALERNPRVLSHVAFFASILSDPEAELFGPSVYPHLGFGELVRLPLDVGINDATWLPSDEDRRARATAGETELGSEPDELPELPLGDSEGTQ